MTSVDYDVRKHINRWVPRSSKLLLINSQDRTDVLEALFNPTELGRTIAVNIGKLEPIGWSSPVLEYASTGEVKFQLKFYLSAIALKEQQSPDFLIVEQSSGNQTVMGLRQGAKQTTGIETKIRWLESFCYSDAPGLAPPPLFVIWPRNLNVLAVLTGIQTTIRMFDEQQIPRIAEVTADFSELRFGFRRRSTFLAKGLMAIDDDAYTAVNGQLQWNPGRPGSTLRVAKRSGAASIKEGRFGYREDGSRWWATTATAGVARVRIGLGKVGGSVE